MKLTNPYQKLAVVVTAIAAATAVACSATSSDSVDDTPVEKEAKERVSEGTAPQAKSQDSNVVSQETQIIAAAEAQLPSYLEQIPEGVEGDYGFTDRAEFKLAKLGTPYEYFTLQDSGEVVAQEQWGVPVTVDGNLRALIKVTKDADGYAAHAFGSARMATELEGIEDARRAAKAEAITSRSIVRSYSTVSTFIAFDADLRANSTLHGVNLMPLESARMAFGGNVDVVSDAQRDSLRDQLDIDTLKPLMAQ
jgi:hypothetical protein